MSHFCVLVIGPNVESQMAPYEESLNKDDSNKEFFEFKDIEEEYRKKYETETRQEYLDSSNSSWGRVARCCLGHACYVFGYEKFKQDACLWSHEEQSASILPSSVAIKLNITQAACLTLGAVKVVNEFLSINKITIASNFHNDLFTLWKINDQTEISMLQMGELIEKLAQIEKEQNIEMFLSMAKSDA